MEGVVKEDNSSETGLEMPIKSSNYYITGFPGQGRQWISGGKTKLLLVEK